VSTALAAFDALQEQQAALERDFPQWLVTLPSGARVALRQCGKGAGPTIVLLHGIVSAAASWLHVARLLAHTHHVVAWDAPGYGHSTALPAPAPVASDYAEHLHDVLQTFGVERCTVVGHSLGALMACALALLHPERVDRVVLISPARGYAGSPEEAARVKRQRLDALQAQGVSGIAARIDERLLSSAASQEARDWVRWNAARLHLQGYRQAVEMLCGSALAPLPAGMPVEVHCGDMDVVTSPSQCAQLAQSRGVPYHPIPGAGHASPVEQPAYVAALLARAAAQTKGTPNA